MKAKKKEIIDRIAQAGFERMFDEQWDDLKDKVLWREIANDMFDAISLMAKEWKNEKKT